MAGYVELYNLSKIYDPTGNVAVVRGFNLDMPEGEFVSLIGHSGCGKSTVLTMVAGLNSISEGGVVVAKREIRGPGPDRGVVFQSPCLLPWMSVFDNVKLGVERVFPHATRAERSEMVGYYLSIVGLGNAMRKFPSELSEGMKQRVGIARAFALQPKMLLLDEPFGKLDSLTRMELQEVLLAMLQKTPMTTLCVTHDVDEALFLSDRIVMMTNGPEARVGELLTVPFVRPRTRGDVLAHALYYELRGAMIGFLEEQDHVREQRKVAAVDVAQLSAPAPA
jgi:nitrate/nitrite transport system ATP-binding protein